MAASAERTPAWQRGKVASWLVTTDHKRIGILYISTSLVFFLLAGLMALVFRLQLSQANASILGPERYNQLITIHGTAMVFLVIVPLLAGFGNFLVPLMIGARDVAFPRLNALSYWLFVLGGAVLMLSFFAAGGAAQNGWTSYPPLSVHQAGHGQDLWILSLHILSAASLAGAINFIVTIHNTRTRGMTWTRMPLFVWSMLLYAWLLIAILPTLSAGLTLLLLDRGISFGPWDVQTHFFNPAEGGSPVLYQHAFWFFGHPEVYVIVLPVFGIISEVLPVFARKPVFGYKAIAFSTVAIAFFSMIVWAHHLFTVGLPISLQAYFMIASMIIAVPTGIKIFNWLATLWRGNISFETPMLYALGFLSIFILGGAHRHLPRGLPHRLAGARHVLRRRALPLHALRRWDVRDLRRALLLVAEDVRPAPEREARQVAVLDALHRVQRGVLPPVPPGSRGNAAARLHLLARELGGIQRRLDRRLVCHGDRDPVLHLERRPDVAQRAESRQRSVAGGHPRVVHDLSTAAVQFRRGARRHERQTSLRSSAKAA